MLKLYSVNGEAFYINQLIRVNRTWAVSLELLDYSVIIVSCTLQSIGSRYKHILEINVKLLIF